MTTSVAPSYRFARSPRWLLSHLMVLVLVVSMLVAGFWQVDRHRSRAERNDLVQARSVLMPVPLGSVAGPAAAASVGDSEQFRRVSVRGEYRPQDEVLIRNRTLDGAPGWWVLTPLVTDEGWGVAVNRGWIPLAYDADSARPGTEAPSGVVEIVGSIQPARVAEGFQRADPGAGRLTSLGRPDIERLEAQLDYELSPVVVRVDPSTIEPGVQPIPLSLPSLDGGPHLSYSVQWFIFTLIAVAGYPLILRRVATGRARSAPDEAPEDKDGERAEASTVLGEFRIPPAGSRR